MITSGRRRHIGKKGNSFINYHADMEVLPWKIKREIE